MGEEYSFYNHLLSLSQKQPSSLAITVDGVSLTYKELLEQADEVASGLAALGIRKDDKVALILQNSPLWYSIFWGVIKIGAVPVPLDPQIGQWELGNILSLVECSCCFTVEKYRAVSHLSNVVSLLGEKLKNIVLVGEGELPQTSDKSVMRFDEFVSKGEKQECESLFNERLMLACTSGSTGNPKVIDVPQTGFFKAEMDMANYLSFDQRESMFLGMPLYHQGGFGMGLQMILKGGHALYQMKFTPEAFLETVEDKKVTVLQLSPTLAKIILTMTNFDQYDLSSVRLAYFAGEVLHHDLATHFSEKLQIPVVNIVGSTETATMLVWDSSIHIDHNSNSFEKLPFTDVMVLDDEGKPVNTGEKGTIYISTDALLTQYYGNRELTNKVLIEHSGKQWFCTGDMGMVTTEGRISFIGRVKRSIKRGANLVHPEEVESYLLTHPDIRAVAVVGQEDEYIGEKLVAYIETEKPLTRGNIMKFCRGQLSAYKIPDHFEFVTELPKLKGKVEFKACQNQTTKRSGENALS